MKNVTTRLLLATCLAAAMPALASEFSVTPVRIFMGPRDRAVAVTLTNEGDEEVVMQAQLFSWKQKPGGEDDLVPTEDMILSPPIVKLAPRSRQVVRLARLTPPPVGGEETFRLIVREVPEAKPPTKEVKLQVALAFSLPVFVTPATAKRRLLCEPARAAADTVRITCRNEGTAYAQARGFALVSDTGDKIAARDTGGYILPTIARAFDVKRNEGRIGSGRIKVQVTFDDGSVQTFDGLLAD